MSIKQAAEELLKIADDIEREAAEVTQFVCDKCNHTATLATINLRRKEAASEIGDNVTVSEITVNDKVSCPACDGVMGYVETEASKDFYFDPDRVAEETSESYPEEEKQKEEEKEEKSEEKKAFIDYDSLERYLNK